MRNIQTVQQQRIINYGSNQTVAGNYQPVLKLSNLYIKIYFAAFSLRYFSTFPIEMLQVEQTELESIKNSLSEFCSQKHPPLLLLMIKYE